MKLAKLIDTATFAPTMRDRILRPERREILVSRFTGSGQEADLTVPANCDGLGRVRHFRRHTAEGWPTNPLPIDPALKRLGLAPADELPAQLFQNAACGWRCWYCFVPFNMLTGNEQLGEWVTAEDLIDLYLREPNRSPMIDLSGGSPDLTPEWVVWTMEALEDRDVHETTYLWSDDNLSTDYVVTKLSQAQRDRLVSYKNYGRVCCFKGFDADAFAFNTGAAPASFDDQFQTFDRYLDLGLDLYGYVTFTGPDPSAVEKGIPRFLDRLQALHENLPLRIAPLRIEDFTPTKDRSSKMGDQRFAIARPVQEAAIALWTAELARRFESHQLQMNVADVPMSRRS
jgi:uncharacterized Fe-S cluster-containing radical SAM superfamily protein